MKIIVKVILTILLFCTNSNGQTVKVIFYLNDQEFDPLVHRKTLDSNSEIKIKLFSSDKTVALRFGDIYVEKVLRRYLPSRARGQQQAQELRIKDKRRKDKLSKYIKLDNEYKSNPEIIIPFSIFYDKCLSRVIFQLTKAFIKKGFQVETVNPESLRYEREYSFYASWACYE